MGRDSTTESDIVIPENEIQGNPRPAAIAQWVPHEVRPWWTEDALSQKRGLIPDRTTGRFVERSAIGWRLRVLGDEERARLFRDKGVERV